MKKVLAFAGSAALVFSMAVPTLAFYRFRRSDDTSVRNYASVTNRVDVEAETGDNEIGGKCVAGGRIVTGDAEAMLWELSNRVNWNNVDNTDSWDDISVKNRARVYNNVDVEAETGDNEIGGRYVWGGLIRSGSAYADGLIDNVVNTTIIGN